MSTTTIYLVMQDNGSYDGGASVEGCYETLTEAVASAAEMAKSAGYSFDADLGLWADLHVEADISVRELQVGVAMAPKEVRVTL